ncbi:MAG: histidine kinase [Bacteroidota bacterium]
MMHLIKTITFRLVLFIWIAVCVIHFLVLYFVFHITMGISLSDSLIYNLLLLVAGSGFWYMVKYAGEPSAWKLRQAGYFLAGIIFLVAFWLMAGYMILFSIFEDNLFYAKFLTGSLLFRGITGMLAGTVMVMVFFLLLRGKELDAKALREAQLENSLRQTELNMLRSQIRPHFLFNALNSVNSLTLSDPPRARDMIVKLSEYFRFSLGMRDEQLIRLKDEIYYTGLYLEIEKVRFGDKLITECNIPDEMQEMKIPALILQPLVENAVKYGAYESLETCSINISASTEGEILRVKVWNSTETAPASTVGTGTGLRNTLERMKLVYGDSSLLKYNRTDQSFEVTLEIPQIS